MLFILQVSILSEQLVTLVCKTGINFNSGIQEFNFNRTVAALTKYNRDVLVMKLRSTKNDNNFNHC